jgi:uncharacterized membrane protein (DUF485 family)
MTMSNHSSTGAEAKSIRRGLKLFSVYCFIYCAFMGISAFRPEWLHVVMPGGVNVAIAYGFGLIFSAFLIAVIYLFTAGSKKSGSGS